MTAVDPLAAAVAELGALPMPVGVKPFQTVPPRPEAADVPLSDLQRLIARQKFEQRMAPLVAWRAHPETPIASKPASDGERAEQGHLKHDADPDSTTPAFPDLSKGKPWRAS